jgi:hypothetical protein
MVEKIQQENLTMEDDKYHKDTEYEVHHKVVEEQKKHLYDEAHKVAKE